MGNEWYGVFFFVVKPCFYVSPFSHQPMLKHLTHVILTIPLAFDRTFTNFFSMHIDKHSNLALEIYVILT